MAKQVDRLLGTAVYLQRHAHAVMLGWCMFGADSEEDCSTGGIYLQTNVWDATTRRDIVKGGITGCVDHTVEAAHCTVVDAASPKIPFAFDRDVEGAAVSSALRIGPGDTASSLAAASPCARNTASPDHHGPARI
ncbi:hypothetical protein [Streptomyces sp. NPDC001828]|uniref:hypothetical protein n=1 Tax=Streptomyces sp. NPDC001828 TaxID=3364615 RepID=UPI0036B01E7B